MGKDDKAFMQRKDWAARVDGLVVFRGLLQSEPLASLRAALAADAAGLTGAVAGALAGIVYGIEGIPDTWLEMLRAKDLIDACLF